MKKIKKAILSMGMVGIIGVMQCATNSYATTKGIVTVETIRLRSEASTSSSIIELLSQDDEVEIIEDLGSWYKVKYDGKTGYLNKKYVKTEENNEKEENKTSESEKSNTTKNEETNNVTNTSSSSETTENTSVNNNSESTNTTTQNDVNAEEDNIIQSESTNTEMQEQDTTNNYIENDVTKDIKERVFSKSENVELINDVNVRILPLINSSSIDTIKKNTTVKISEVINKWCYIESQENTGWVSCTELNNSIKSENNNETGVVGTENESTENQENVENRTENSENTVSEEEATTKNTSEENATTGNTVTENKVSDTSSDDKKETSLKEMNKTGYVNVGTVNVRTKPDISSDVVDCLSQNSKVTVLGEIDSWYKIKTNSLEGYIASKYISDKKVEETTSRSATKARESEITDSEETTSNDEANTSGTSGSGVVSYAKQYLGYKYVSGGASPSKGFDCSGFTSYVYKHFGISLNRTSSAQSSNGTAVSKASLQQGDLVLFKGSSGSSIGHVGIYIGGNQFIHAATPSKGVIISSLSEKYYSTRYVTARRILQ